MHGCKASLGTSVVVGGWVGGWPLENTSIFKCVRTHKLLCRTSAAAEFLNRVHLSFNISCFTTDIFSRHFGVGVGVKKG